MDDSAPGWTSIDDLLDDDAGPSPRHRVLLVIGLLVLASVTTWIFGHLPWVLSGFSWPTTEAAPVGSSSEGLAGVRIAIPLVAAYLPSLVAFTAIGATTAGVLPVLFPALPRAGAVAGAGLAAVVTTAVVTYVARSTIQDHAADAFAGDHRVLDGLVAVVAVTTLVGLAVGGLAALQPGFLPVAVALAVGQLPTWLDGFVLGRDHGPDVLRTLDRVGDVATFVLLAAAFVLSTRRSPWWAVLWPVAVALLWVAAPFEVLLVHLAGQLRPSSGLPDALPDIVAGAVDAFRASFWSAHRAVWPWLAALGVGVVWLVVRGRFRARR